MNKRRTHTENTNDKGGGARNKTLKDPKKKMPNFEHNVLDGHRKSEMVQRRFKVQNNRYMHPNIAIREERSANCMLDKTPLRNQQMNGNKSRTYLIQKTMVEEYPLHQVDRTDNKEFKGTMRE